MTEAEEVPTVSSMADRERQDGPLPGPVRARVVSLAAECLERLPREQSSPPC